MAKSPAAKPNTPSGLASKPLPAPPKTAAPPKPAPAAKLPPTPPLKGSAAASSGASASTGAGAGAAKTAKKPRTKSTTKKGNQIIPEVLPRRQHGYPIKLVKARERKPGDPKTTFERILNNPLEIIDVLRDRPTWMDDIAAIAMMSLGFVTLLTLLGNPSQTSVSLSDMWADLISQIFGRVGAFLVAFMVIGAGALIVLPRVNIAIALPWRRVLSIEVAFLALLAILHLMIRDSEPRAIARAGLGGGYVGWALAEVVAKLFGSGLAFILYVLILGLATVFALGIRKKQARKWMEAASKKIDALSAELKKRAAAMARPPAAREGVGPGHWAAPLSGGAGDAPRDPGHAIPLARANTPIETPIAPTPEPERPAAIGPVPIAAAEALGKPGKRRTQTGPIAPVTPAAATVGTGPLAAPKKPGIEIETPPAPPPLTPQPAMPVQPPPLQKPAFDRPLTATPAASQPETGAPGKRRTGESAPSTPRLTPAAEKKPAFSQPPGTSPIGDGEEGTGTPAVPVVSMPARPTPIGGQVSTPHGAVPPPERRTRYFTVEDFKELRRSVPRVGLPSLELLDDTELNKPTEEEVNANARIIENTLLDFDLDVEVVDVKIGPTVTQYAVQPFREVLGDQGASTTQRIRVTKIQSLSNDLALALAAKRLRIQAFVPGHSYMGIEVPNRTPAIVAMRPIMESETFARTFVKFDPDMGREREIPLVVPLGRDVAGEAVVVDLATMPHLLIAGTTGSGKSVAISAMITALILDNKPDRLKLVLLDPKMVELMRFNGIPHLLGPVETDIERIVGVLRWATREMDRRYKLLEGAAARNIEVYNRLLGDARKDEHLPYMVIFIDEIGDLMLSRPDEIERTITRLAQMARAVGIHLVVATQRPSTDIITGLIKANFPARISFAVVSGVDSRVILDQVGAETLVGRGDMLYLAPDAGAPRRVQGCYVADPEIDEVVKFWKRWKADQLAAGAQPTEETPWERAVTRRESLSDSDPMLEDAIDLVVQAGEASTSAIQKQLNIPYPRAAQLMDLLNELGILGAIKADGRTREVMLKPGTDPYKKLMAKYKKR